MNRRRRASMRDVAAQAGVSVATVSRVLTAKGAPVSEELRSKVIASCERLSYTLNPAVQDLVRERRNGTTRNIAFVTVTTGFADPAYSKVLEGIAKSVNEFGYNLSLAHLTGEEGSVYELPPILRDDRIDGLLLTGRLTAATTSLLRQLDKPQVIIGAYTDQVLGGADNVRVSTSALINGFVEALADLGKSRIGCFLENPDNYYQQACRFEFKQALAQRSLPFDEQLCYYGSGPFSGAFRAMRPVIRGGKLPFDGLVCDNYRCAQEISHLLAGVYGLEAHLDICIATILPDPAQCLYAPALVCRDIGDRVAYQALKHLVDKLQGRDDDNPLRLEISPDKPIYAAPDYTENTCSATRSDPQQEDEQCQVKH